MDRKRFEICRHWGRRHSRSPHMLDNQHEKCIHSHWRKDIEDIGRDDHRQAIVGLWVKPCSEAVVMCQPSGFSEVDGVEDVEERSCCSAEPLLYNAEITLDEFVLSTVKEKINVPTSEIPQPWVVVP